MSRASDCDDNTAMESFFGSLKTELVHHETYAIRRHASTSIFRSIEGRYNRCRHHSSLAYLSPDQHGLMAINPTHPPAVGKASSFKTLRAISTNLLEQSERFKPVEIEPSPNPPCQPLAP